MNSLESNIFLAQNHPHARDSRTTFTWYLILSIAVGGALLLSGVVFTARKLVTTRENNNSFVQDIKKSVVNVGLGTGTPANIMARNTFLA